ncbi:hypothetical protein DSO57_1035891 [Entomophthora muscae]|uniref:Uncharacterized protein n=1 Tax=Entomophthora muscae TaxID=34485 RepID=A0ACC2TY26_9FUNG|nr:hypothetical protein DSO57_1035891 [Entomophthora muscae]
MSKITNLIAGLKNFTFASKVKLTPCLGNLNVPRLYSTEPVAPEKDASILKGDMPLPQLDLPPQVQRYTGKVNLADLPEEKCSSSDSAFFFKQYHFDSLQPGK